MINIRTLSFYVGLKGITGLKGIASANYLWINVCCWETANLPLSKPNILPKAKSRC